MAPRWLAALSLVLVLVSNQPGKAQVTMNDSTVRAILTDINADTIRYVMQTLQNFGTRYARASNHRAVAEWIQGQFMSYGLTGAYLDSFYSTANGWQYNVIAPLPGGSETDTVMVLGGHYDSYAYGSPLTNAPGADDNASGTAAAMEVARILAQRGVTFRSTVLFMAFAAEELGLLGSEDCAAKMANQNVNVRMMINNDMISYCTSDSTNWRIALQQYPNSATVTNLATHVCTTYTQLAVTYRSDDIQYSDSWSFYQQGYKTIFLQEYEFTPYYHSVNDLVVFSNLPYTRAMVQVSAGMLLVDNFTIVGVPPADAHPSGFALLPNYPNPFNPSTVILYQLPASRKTSLRIYNVLGQEVRTLVNGVEAAGTHTVTWDGRDHRGQSVASGVYLYRLESGGLVMSRKMTLMK